MQCICMGALVSSPDLARSGVSSTTSLCCSRTSLVMEVAGDNGVPDFVLNRAREITAQRKKREQVNCTARRVSLENMEGPCLTRTVVVCDLFS
jgi:hypothetical protein